MSSRPADQPTPAASAPVHLVDWKPFGQTRLSGYYWITGYRPVDEGDSGQPQSVSTGEVEEYIALVGIDFDPESDLLDVETMNYGAAGYWDEACTISHYAPFVPPVGPQ